MRRLAMMMALMLAAMLNTLYGGLRKFARAAFQLPPDDIEEPEAIEKAAAVNRVRRELKKIRLDEPHEVLWDEMWSRVYGGEGRDTSVLPPHLQAWLASLTKDQVWTIVRTSSARGVEHHAVMRKSLIEGVPPALSANEYRSKQEAAVLAAEIKAGQEEASREAIAWILEQGEPIWRPRHAP